jgi:hypothetical protein
MTDENQQVNRHSKAYDLFWPIVLGVFCFCAAIGAGGYGYVVQFYSRDLQKDLPVLLPLYGGCALAFLGLVMCVVRIVRVARMEDSDGLGQTEET